MSPDVRRLGELADVGIVYVTGDNDFFHVDNRTVARYQLPERYLRPALRGGGELAGLRFTHEDWGALHRLGRANLLLCLPASLPPNGAEAYLEDGARRGVPARYKCRVREPWFAVPHVYEADAFLTYMSGAAPKLVANESR